ncbi:photosystem P840 reaction center protein PscD [Prosthecochloris sp. N3]|uniref:Photosystem P840 reaction center protein PscD n=1 Tax=Prosthecochloris ethylica TaxID=2743976 RepID=A0ABR9XRN8_9CHLB|nr:MULTISPECIES: photosystem P840 reaction center protein PscD [Prosthecochloris]MEC9486594.1 photosystem P840 reaction center protein PscD [Prosthecochloris sp.]MBF0586799.1 photosystem P840 reaction center protein PscD [Prosthecochloris ethylica]MBF0636705.1 photosystem P840 reaction center protein PscD [Prosthecochloris ethylica]NUK47896.1 photosystem P840 reaction center protein PscD [Prosthecochloris ethylica]RNA66512.1 reaction center protein [Prosthecochloris sp. ZM_2]
MHSAVWSGNALHKATKYYITSAKRDRNGQLDITISPASGRTKLKPTEHFIDQLKNGEVQLLVLTTQSDIAIDLNKKVLDNENRYVIDFDNRGVKWTMRDMPVYFNNMRQALCIEVDGVTYTLDEFFK